MSIVTHAECDRCHENQMLPRNTDELVPPSWGVLKRRALREVHLCPVCKGSFLEWLSNPTTHIEAKT